MITENRKISNERTSEVLKQEPMMKAYDTKIETEVTKTMKLLEQMPQLEAHHLFRVRVMQRVEAESSRKSGKIANARGQKADVRFAFMALLFIVNVGSAVLSLQNSKAPSKTEVSELSDASGEDYSAQEFAYYDQTGSEPAVSGITENLTPGR